MRRVWVVAGFAVIAALLATIGVLYVYGTPQPGSTVYREPASVAQMPVTGVPEQQAEVPADAQAPAPDPESPLAISIPGCKCHSDDSELVKQHEGYRMNQCAGCHAGRVPTGQ